MTYDVAVIGAGPSGATLARLLASAGARVVMLESRRLPRAKPCGGGLTIRALRLLPPEAQPVIQTRIHGLDAFWRNHHLRVRAPEMAAATTTRAELDAVLAGLAADAGAEVHTATPVRAATVSEGAVTVEGASGSWRTRLVACADGATGPSNGPFGQALGFRRRAPRIPALEADIPWFSDDEPRLRADFCLVPRGYGWVFPRAQVASVGIGSWVPGFSGAALRSALAAYGAQLGVPDIASNAKGHPIPVGGALPRHELVTSHALRIGDAAGLADPFLGEGIGYALESAHLAAAAILADDPPRYARDVLRLLYGRFREARLLGRIIYGAPQAVFTAVSALPILGTRLYSWGVSYPMPRYTVPHPSATTRTSAPQRSAPT